MYLWKVDELVEDLKAGRVSQWEQFKYCLTLAIILSFLLATLGMLVFVGAAPEGVSVSNFDVIFLLLYFVTSIAIAVPGIWVCYKINSDGDDADFILRMVCLAIPVVIRTAVFLNLPLSVVFHIIGTTLADLANLALAYGLNGYVAIILYLAVVNFVPYAYLAFKIYKVSSDA